MTRQKQVEPPTNDRTKALRSNPRFKELEDLRRQRPTTDDLLWYHRVGRCIELLFPASRREYGERNIEFLSKHLTGRNRTQAALRKLRSFYVEYRLSDLESLRKPDGNGFLLSWEHVRLLVGVRISIRKQVQAECIRKEWPCNHLLAYINEALAAAENEELEKKVKRLKWEERERKKRDEERKREEEDQPPKSMSWEENLKSLISESDRWLRQQDGWFSASVPAFFERTSPHDLKQLPNLLTEAIDIMTRMAAAAKSCKKTLAELQQLTERRRVSSKATTRRIEK